MSRHSFHTPTPAFSPPPPSFIHPLHSQPPRSHPSPPTSAPGLDRSHHRQDADEEELERPRGVHFASQSSHFFPSEYEQEFGEDEHEQKVNLSQVRAPLKSPTILSIISSKSKIGACVYFGEKREKERSWNAKEGEEVGTFGLLGDWDDGPRAGGEGWDIVRMLLHQIQPSIVLTSSASSPSTSDPLPSTSTHLPPTSFSSTLEQILSDLPRPFKVHRLPNPSASSDSDSDSTSSDSTSDSDSDSDSGNATGIKLKRQKPDKDRRTQLEYRSPREFNAKAGRDALARLRVEEDEFEYEEDERGGDGSGGGTGAGGGERERRWEGLRLEGLVEGLVEGGMDLTLSSAYCLISYLSRTLSTNATHREPSNDFERDFEHEQDEERRGRNKRNDQDDRVTVKNVVWLKLEKVLQVSTDTLACVRSLHFTFGEKSVIDVASGFGRHSALQIFSSESHASSHSSAKKEGLSLFGILSITHSPLGFHRLRQWFLRPSLELEVIHQRQDSVSCFLRPENQHPATSIQKNLNSIKNFPQTLRKLKEGKGVLRDWKATWSFIYAILMIRESVLLLTHSSGLESVHRLLHSFDDQAVKELGTTINDVIDWDESKEQKGRIIIKRGIDTTLDEMRRTYAGLPSLLTRIATDIAAETSAKVAETLNVVYFPQMGFLITVPREDIEGSETEVDINEEEFEEIGWKYQFATEQNLFFKNDKCFDLDYHIGDVSTCIQEKEIEILHILLEKLLTFEPQLLTVCDRLADLDCLLAFADAARMYSWTKPMMVEEPVCQIAGGRHPLVELCVDSFVSNDISLAAGHGVYELEEEKPDVDGLLDPNGSILIVTGSNYSGKSIFMKQTALITFLAHLGSFVPAESAVIGLTDRILTRVSTKESVTRGSSAFMMDLQQISFMLRNATRHSLLLIDEFGKGTESNDGAGLFVGIINEIFFRGSDTPRTIVATHFQHVLMQDFVPKHPSIGLAHMEVLVDKQSDAGSASGASSNRVTYLYRLSQGLDSSHAASCAALFGIEESILARAKHVTNLLARFEADKLQQEALDPDALRELEDCEEVARRFLEWDLGGDEVEDMSAEELIEKIQEVVEGERDEME